MSYAASSGGRVELRSAEPRPCSLRNRGSTPLQAKIVRNAARYLTSEAQESAIAFGSTDNRNTYNNTSSVNLTGNNFYVWDEQDIRSLAVEIAILTRRQQRGRGLRMA